MFVLNGLDFGRDDYVVWYGAVFETDWGEDAEDWLADFGDVDEFIGFWGV